MVWNCIDFLNFQTWLFLLYYVGFQGEGLIEGAIRLLAAIIVHKSCANSIDVARNIGKQKEVSCQNRVGVFKKIVRGWSGSWILNLPYGFLNSLSFPNNISQENPLRI